MIPKSHKFPLRTEFLEFRRRAKRQTTPHFQLLSLPHVPIPSDRSELQAISRLAVIIPKKLSKLATTRNWLKRLTFDTLWPLIKNKRIDCVVVYKPLPLKKSMEAKQQILSELTSSFPIIHNS